MHSDTKERLEKVSISSKKLTSHKNLESCFVKMKNKDPVQNIQVKVIVNKHLNNYERLLIFNKMCLHLSIMMLFRNEDQCLVF